MLAHYLPELVDAQPYEIYELSAYLDAAAPLSELNRGRRLAYHDSCHMLRELGIADASGGSSSVGRDARAAPRPDLCCGFGGTFSVRQPEVSVALADEKLAGAGNADALVTADPGC